MTFFFFFFSPTQNIWGGSAWRSNILVHYSINMRGDRDDDDDDDADDTSPTYFIIFTQPLRSGRIWHKVNF